MIAFLRGTIGKESPGSITVDVQGVGYGVAIPMQDWDSLVENQEQCIHISTYIREDRMDLYGFTDRTTKVLFESLIELSGIGPRMGLELCDVPRNLLLQAVRSKDATLLTSVKGVGKKSAEKLLLELASLAEKNPEIFAGTTAASIGAQYDRDTVDALSQLGFSMHDIMRALEEVPDALETTEERVAAALRSL